MVLTTKVPVEFVPSRVKLFEIGRSISEALPATTLTLQKSQELNTLWSGPRSSSCDIGSPKSLREMAGLYNVRFWEDALTTPPALTKLLTLERTVLGRERLGKASAPTCSGLFDPEPLVEQLGPSLVGVVVAFDTVGGHCA